MTLETKNKKQSLHLQDLNKVGELKFDVPHSIAFGFQSAEKH